jgi:hypothetical protein
MLVKSEYFGNGPDQGQISELLWRGSQIPDRTNVYTI